MKTPAFGALPSGKSLEKVKNSKNYIDGEFRNKEKTELLTDTKKTPIKRLLEFAFEKDPKGTVPKIALPSVKTDLKTLDPNEDLIVWFGHSSLFIQIAGKKILVDPVFSKYASPVPFSNKAFEGTNIYTVDDLPEIDVLLITHDHYDHLDYPTVKKLKDKVAKVIVPLGVDAHLLRWGFDEEKITTVDWDDEVTIDENLKIYALEARYFSGREFFNRNQSLWVSYLIEEKYNNDLYRLFLSGDGGYSQRFKAFKEKFQNSVMALTALGTSQGMTNATLFSVQRDQYLIGELNPHLNRVGMHINESASIPAVESLNQIQQATRQFEYDEQQKQIAQTQTRGMSLS